MGEEVRMSEYQTTANGGGVEREARVMEWEIGLPAADDLTPLSQPLIPPDLASAFSISMDPCRTLLDVTRASQTTLSNLHLNTLSSTAANNFKSFASAAGANNSNEPMVVEEEEEEEGEEEVEDEDNSPGADQDGSGSDTRNNKLRRLDSEEADSAARTLKRPRLVWTPQLHKRFVDVVAHLGIKNAVPKTIMQLMNVEGLTRENVASHLQKYRLYLKRMQGFSSSEGGAAAGPAAAAALSSDHQLFASTPVPQSLNESNGNRNGNGNMGMPMQTMAYHQHHHHPMGMQMYGNVGMHNYHSHHQYQNGFDHGNFNYGNGYGSGGAFPHHNHHHHYPHQVGSNDNNVM